MKRFIPREKLSKKARRRRDSAGRNLWTVPPVTRRVESAKAYNRKRLPRAADLAMTRGFFMRVFCFGLRGQVSTWYNDGEEESRGRYGHAQGQVGARVGL